MENVIQTLGILSVANTAIVQLIKFLLGKADILVSGLAATILSWVCPVAGAFVLNAMGVIDANFIGTVL